MCAAITGYNHIQAMRFSCQKSRFALYAVIYLYLNMVIHNVQNRLKGLTRALMKVCFLAWSVHVVYLLAWSVHTGYLLTSWQYLAYGWL